MTDIEKVLTDVREAAEKVPLAWKVWLEYDCGEDDFYALSLAISTLNKALAAFTEEMPGAIGEVVSGASSMVKQVNILASENEIGEAMLIRGFESYRVTKAALAKLDGK